jgi:SAM-dependent methyltransferase
MSVPDSSVIHASSGLHSSAPAIHPGTTILGEPLTIRTPLPCWSYAVSFRWSGESHLDGRRTLRISIAVTVHQGRVGVGTIRQNGRDFIEERYVDCDTGRVVVHLHVSNPDDLQMVMVRNASSDGASRVSVEPPEAVWIERHTLAAHGTVVHRDLALEPRRPDAGVVFEDATARAINEARLAFLDRLQLPLAGRRVLDVGCGVGHFASYYVSRGSEVVGVDGRAENIALMAERLPAVGGYVMDVQTADLAALGRFDLIHCFGLLYHLDNPVAALRRMADACEGLLLIETMVCDSSRPVVVLVDESLSANQALQGLASRPSPSYIAMALNRIGFRHIYGAAEPPDHPDFLFDWRDNLDVARNGHNLRCVFAASRAPFEREGLIPLVVG